jgi:RNA polymerase sigma factor (TIGR02999 family)
MAEITRILNAIEKGDPRATEELLPLVYEELRLLAAQKLSHEPPGQTLQATALVHEAYIRLVERKCRNWNSRNHFFMAAAEAMRRILIENARRKYRLKHGGRQQRINLYAEDLAIEGPSDDLIALDEALTKLAETDKIKADLVKLRYFAGLTLEQAAQALDISPSTAQRYWVYSKAWLFRKIQDLRTENTRERTSGNLKQQRN